jgi:CRISPR/Cas system-associated endonuclease Cas3-HD
MLGLPSNTSLPIDEIGLFPLEIKTLLEQNLKKKRCNSYQFVAILKGLSKG